jgi:hypothetical protein
MEKWGLVEIRFNISNEVHIYATQSLDLDWLTAFVPNISIDESGSTQALGVWRYVITGVKEMIKTVTWSIMRRLAEDGWELVSRSDDYYATHMFKRKTLEN